jgi:hypothetical protein
MFKVDPGRGVTVNDESEWIIDKLSNRSGIGYTVQDRRWLVKKNS